MTRKVPWVLVILLAAFFVPAAGSRYYTFVANDVVIWALFATSLNLLVGYTGLVSFGILLFPRFSIFSIFALMAAVLIIRPWGLLGKPLK